jgi:hypothetical protein
LVIGDVGKKVHDVREAQFVDDLLEVHSFFRSVCHAPST